jgi:CRP/FNR family transcriptional regulator, dissimilatory nitrate respiration regulator
MEVDWKTVERTLPLLAALPDTARAAVRLLELEAGGPLFRAGTTPSAMFFVLSGEVRLVRSSRSGGEIVLQRAKRGVLAEASLDQSAYHCDALASTQSAVLSIPRAVVQEALKTDRFASAWRAELSRELRRLRAQCERLSLKTAKERIVHYIETEGENGAVALGQSKKQWAAELGLTHEALYRSLAEMEKVGSVRTEGGTIRLFKVRRGR